jgi:hypothetical protein
MADLSEGAAFVYNIKHHLLFSCKRIIRLFINSCTCYHLPVIDFYRFHKKAHDELNQFVESIHYRDFSETLM